MNYDAIISDIIGDQQRAATSTGNFGFSAVDPISGEPVMHLQIECDYDGYEVLKNCHILEDGVFRELKMKELRRKRCEWAMDGTILLTLGCRLVYKPVERNALTDEVEAWDCRAEAWDFKGKKWISFDDDFTKNFAKHFEISEEEAKKMEDYLMQHSNPDVNLSTDLVFYAPRKF